MQNIIHWQIDKFQLYKHLYYHVLHPGKKLTFWTQHWRFGSDDFPFQLGWSLGSSRSVSGLYMFCIFSSPNLHNEACNPSGPWHVFSPTWWGPSGGWKRQVPVNPGRFHQLRLVVEILRFQKHPRWLFGISAINSITLRISPNHVC